MFLTISYYSIISFVFIFVVHYLYEYFKENLTIPKEKDMIEKPKETYNRIYETLQKRDEKKETNNTMKDELKNYLNELKMSTKKKQDTTAEIKPESFSMNSNNVNFSNIGSNGIDNAPTEIEGYSTF